MEDTDEGRGRFPLTAEDTHECGRRDCGESHCDGEHQGHDVVECALIDATQDRVLASDRRVEREEHFAERSGQERRYEVRDGERECVCAEGGCPAQRPTATLSKFAMKKPRNAAPLKNLP